MICGGVTLERPSCQSDDTPEKGLFVDSCLWQKSEQAAKMTTAPTRHLDFVMNMDQIPMFHAMDFQSMIDTVGACTVNLRTAASDTKCVKVAVTITASGRHVKSMVVFKGKSSLIFFFVSNMYNLTIVFLILRQARAMGKLLDASYQPCPLTCTMCASPRHGSMSTYDGMSAQCSSTVCFHCPPGCCSFTPPRFFQGSFAG